MKDRLCPYIDRVCEEDCIAYTKTPLYICIRRFLTPRDIEEHGEIAEIHCFRLLDGLTESLYNIVRTSQIVDNEKE